MLPSIRDGDNSCTVLCDFEEHRHGEVEVGARGIAPAAVVAGLSEVRGAKIGGGD